MDVGWAGLPLWPLIAHLEKHLGKRGQGGFWRKMPDDGRSHKKQDARRKTLDTRQEEIKHKKSEITTSKSLETRNKRSKR